MPENFQQEWSWERRKYEHAAVKHASGETGDSPDTLIFISSTIK